MMCTAAQPLTGAVPAFPHGQYDTELARRRFWLTKGSAESAITTSPIPRSRICSRNTARAKKATAPTTISMTAASMPISTAAGTINLAPGKSPAPLQQRPHDRGYVRSGERAGSFALVGSRAKTRRGRRIQEIPVRGRPYFVDRKPRRAHRSQARRRRRHHRLRRFRRLRHVRHGFVATSSTPSPTAMCNTNSTLSARFPSTPAIRSLPMPRIRNCRIRSWLPHEALEADCRENYHTPYIVDVKDPKNPKIIGLFPRPAAPPDAPYNDFCMARGRFGSHNTQCWLAPGTLESGHRRGFLVQCGRARI